MKENLLDGTTYYAFKIPVTYSYWNLITSYFYYNTCKKEALIQALLLTILGLQSKVNGPQSGPFFKNLHEFI